MKNIRPNALAIIKNKDNSCLLLSKGKDLKTGKIFYRLLGGGIEFGELSNETLKREFKEELGVNIINEKFLCPIENIFEFNSKKGHEITFLFKAKIAENDLSKGNKFKIKDKNNSFAEWISIKEIKKGNITIYPKETLNFL